MVLLSSMLATVFVATEEPLPAFASHGVSLEAYVEVGGTDSAPTATVTINDVWTSSQGAPSLYFSGPDGVEIGETGVLGCVVGMISS